MLFEISIKQNKMINFNNEFARILGKKCDKTHMFILEWIFDMSN